MKNFSLKDLIQLKKGQLLLLIANRSNNKLSEIEKDKEFMDIEEMINNLDINISRKKQELEY